MSVRNWLFFVFLCFAAAVSRIEAQSAQAVLQFIMPSQVMAGSTVPVTLTLTGTGFTANSLVDGLETTFVSSTTLTAVIPPAKLSGPSVSVIHVSNTSPSLPFYIFPADPPAASSAFVSVSGLTLTNRSQLPASTGATGGSTEAAITGTNLLGAAVSVSGAGVTVSYGYYNAAPYSGGFTYQYVNEPLAPFNQGSPYASAVGNTGLQLLFSVAPDAAPGVRTITITTPSGSTSQCSNQLCTFTVIDGGFLVTLPAAPGISGGGYSATELIDGRILVAGGGGSDPAASTHAALFDPSSNSWTATGNLNIGRHGHSAVVLPDGRVLVAGGIKSNNSPTSSTEIYDPATGNWTTSASMINSSAEVFGFLLTNGRVALIGVKSDGTSTNDEYDPVTGMFNAAPLPDVVHDPRRIASALGATAMTGTVLLDGRVFFRKNTSPFCGTVVCSDPTYSGLIYTPALVNGVLTNGTSVPASAPLDGPGLLLSTGQVLISSRAGEFIYDPVSDSVKPSAEGFTTPQSLLRDGRVFAQGQIYTPPGLLHPAPSISTVTPQATSSASAPIIVVISGSNFLPNSAVRFGNKMLVSVFPGGGTLVAFVPPALAQSFDASAITVTNPAPGGGTASANGTVTAPPVVTGITPSVGNPGMQLMATVTGTNLSGASAVSFSGAGVTAAIQSGGDSSHLPVNITIDANAALGSRSLTVMAPAGAYTLNAAFSVQPARPNVPATTPQPISDVEQGNIRTGYVVITPDSNSPVPTTTVTFGIVNGGFVQAQAGLIPSPVTTDASVFVEAIPAIGRRLGVAIANPNNSVNTLTLTLRDDNGTIAGTPQTITLQPQQQLPRFVDELFDSNTIGGAFRGNLRIQSLLPFSVLGLRFSGQEFSTIPVAGLANGAGIPARTLATGTIGGPAALILPQFAMSGGWATQLALVNTAGTTATGRIDILDANGNPMAVRLDGLTQSTFTYSILAGGSFVLVPRDANGQSPF
jgi:hypothetical protein